MKEVDAFKYSFKSRKKVTTVSTKKSVKLRSKGEANFVSDLLYHFLVNSCNISFNDCKRREL